MAEPFSSICPYFAAYPFFWLGFEYSDLVIGGRHGRAYNVPRFFSAPALNAPRFRLPVFLSVYLSIYLCVCVCVGVCVCVCVWLRIETH